MTSLTEYLKKQSSRQLVRLILSLANKYPEVGQYLRVMIDPQMEEEAVNVYKKQVQQEFFPKRRYGKARLSVARKPIADFRKISKNTHHLIDILLHYVEQGVKYTNAYGDIDEPFYDSMESMYDDALKLIEKYELYEEFDVRCKKIVTDTDGIGWGFHDNLRDMYEGCFDNHIEED